MTVWLREVARLATVATCLLFRLPLGYPIIPCLPGSAIA